MINKRLLLRTAISFLCVAAIATSGLPVLAKPSSASLEKQTENLEGELKGLNSELTALGDELVETSSKIEKMAAKVEKAKLDLAAAKLNEESQYKAMSERIKFMYEGGSMSLLHILFSSESMGDFLNKAEYVTTISDYDRNMLKDFQTVTFDIKTKQESLVAQQEELAELQETLSQKEKALKDKISSTSSELADYKLQLARAKAAEEALKQAQNNESSGSIGGDSENSGNSGDYETSDKKNNSNTSKPVSVSDVALMAGILQCEAGSSYEGMIAVGTVIMNRIASPSFPDTLKEVVYQPGQFGPAMTGKLDRVLALGPNSSAYSAAKAVLGGKRHKKVLSCLYFNGQQWTNHPGVNIGGNIFW